MIHDASTDDWERRQRAQAAAFEAIGARYDEAFPHRRIPRIRPDYEVLRTRVKSSLEMM
jgi:hypothetical protein